MVVHDFNESIKLGNSGEENVLGYLRSMERVDSVKDVSRDKEYQAIDVDCLVSTSRGKEIPMEIKTDSYDSGNLFFEYVSSVEQATEGCMIKTEAEILLYYFIKSDKLYIINMNSFREWFYAKKSYFDSKNLKKIIKNKGKTKGTYTSVGYTIPISWVNDNKWCKRVELKRSVSRETIKTS